MPRQHVPPVLPPPSAFHAAVIGQHLIRLVSAGWAALCENSVKLQREESVGNAAKIILRAYYDILNKD